MRAIYLIGRMQDRKYILQIAKNLMREGYCVLIPTRFMGLTEICNDSDLEMLKRADACYIISNWLDSEAAQYDLKWATQLKKQIYVEGHVEPA